MARDDVDPLLKQIGVILVRIFPIGTEYKEILCISPYSVRMREYTDENNSEYGDFLRSPK